MAADTRFLQHELEGLILGNAQRVSKLSKVGGADAPICSGPLDSLSPRHRPRAGTHGRNHFHFDVRAIVEPHDRKYFAQTPFIYLCAQRTRNPASPSTVAAMSSGCRTCAELPGDICHPHGLRVGLVLSRQSRQANGQAFHELGRS